MPERVKLYLFLWIVVIVCVILGVLFPRQFGWLSRARKSKYPPYLSEEKPKLNWSFINIIKALFKLLIFFLIGLAIVYYNFLGLGEAFACKKRDYDCKINAIKNSFKKGNSKQSKSTAGQKTSTRKVVKK